MVRVEDPEMVLVPDMEKVRVGGGEGEEGREGVGMVEKVMEGVEVEEGLRGEGDTQGLGVGVGRWVFERVGEEE